MRRTDIEALGGLAGEALVGTGHLVREAHEGIAGRPFGILGPAAAPVRAIHNGVARAVYTGVSAGLRAAAAGGARVVALPARDGEPPLASDPKASIALGALNGLYGNHLVARRSGLGLEMAIRRDGADVPATPGALAGAFPDCTSRIVVFLHGLCQTDEAWKTRTPSYGERLQDELSFTPVYVRYNTGLRVSENGRRLAGLLSDLVAGWPLRVEELGLVGHAMGGLVARSACHHGELEGRAWTDAVRHVFCLGTPRPGANLEKGVHALGRACAKLPETRALSTLLNARSAGIKDLRHGSCVEQEWCDGDPDEFLRERSQELPFLADAHYHFIAAGPSHPAGYEQLRAWMTSRPARRGAGPVSTRPRFGEPALTSA